MLPYNGIKVVHLEVTSKCNARCPQCPRNIGGVDVNPSLPIADLTLDDAVQLFPEPFVNQLTELYMCGVYGDAVAAQDTLAIFKYLRSISKNIKLKIHTNGSARPPKWWEDLAATNVSVRFAIDGLESTNHLYRVGTKWSTIMQNAKTFIEAGGVAEWTYIIFKHNEHQVEEAQKLSKELGFKKFIVKKTKRFHNAIKGDQIDSTPVLNRNHDVSYSIEPPENPAYKIALTEPWTKNDPQAYLDYILNTPISCKAIEERMIYVSSEGLVMPCCWIGGIYPETPNFKTRQIWEMIDALPEGKESLNGLKHSIKDIVEGEFFTSMIPSRWASATSKDQRLMVCATTCGKLAIHNNQTN